MSSWGELSSEQLHEYHRKDACTIVLLDSRPGTSLGIDIRSFNLGDKFQGVKLVPPGIRFVHYQVGGGITHGIFVNLGPENRVASFRYSAGDEDFIPVSTADRQRIKDAVLNNELDKSLGAYPLDKYAKWSDLASYWTEEIFEKCGIGMNKIVVPVETASLGGYCTPLFTILPNLVNLSRNARNAIRTGRGGEACEASMQYFVDEQGNKLPPSKITEYQMDSTELVKKLLCKSYGDKFVMLLGELQLAFILFMYLASLPGLEFWKVAVHLLCSASKFKRDNEDDMQKFISVLTSQFEMLPVDLFRDELLADNFLVDALAELLNEPGCLEAEINKLKEAIVSQCGHATLSRIERHQLDTEDEFQVAALQVGALTISSDDDESTKQTQATTRMSWMLPPS